MTIEPMTKEEYARFLTDAESVTPSLSDFRRAFAYDDNVVWRLAPGDLANLLDDAIERGDTAETELRDRELHHFEEEQARERAEATIARVRSLIAREGGTNINIVNRILDELEGSPS